MLENTKLHLTIDSKDLTCPICFLPFGPQGNQPITAHCGHTFCSNCFKKLPKCALCKTKLQKKEIFNKSILISSLLESDPQVKKCPVHAKPIEGFCLEKKKFVCFDCLADKKAIFSIKDIEEKVDQLSKITRETQGSSKTHVEKLLKTEQENFKRDIDQLLCREVCYGPMLKGRLYKEIEDFTIGLEKVYSKNALLDEIKKTEIMLEKWRRSNQQDDELTIGVLETKLDLNFNKESFEKMLAELKREIIKNQNQLLEEINRHQSLIKCLSKKIQRVLERPPYMLLDSVPVDLELQYLVEICKEFNLLAMQTNYREILMLKEPPVPNLQVKINQIFFDCRINRLNIGGLYSLNCLPTLPIFAQILETSPNLQSLAITLFKISESEVVLLSNLLGRLKNLKDFSIRINRINHTKPLLVKLCDRLRSLEWFSRFEIQLENGFFYETLRVKSRD